MSTNTKYRNLNILIDDSKQAIRVPLWATYMKYVRSVVLPYDQRNLNNIAHWQNNFFFSILLYMIPLSVIALIPGVYMSFTKDVPFLGLADLFAFSLLVLIVVKKRVTLVVRKWIPNTSSKGLYVGKLGCRRFESFCAEF